MTRFFYPGQTKCRVCGKAATICDYCDEHWKTEGREKVLKEAKRELNAIEQEKDFEYYLYYNKMRCV